MRETQCPAKMVGGGSLEGAVSTTRVCTLEEVWKRKDAELVSCRNAHRPSYDRFSRTPIDSYIFS